MYEPAMTKSFLHGRTEAIRSVQPESVEFTKVGGLSCYISSGILILTHNTDILL